MGLILPQMVETKVVSISYKYYQNKGYIIPKHIGFDKTEKISIGEIIKVHVLDLMNVSHVKVKIQCDYCGDIDEVEWVKVIDSINNKENDKITCHNCNGKKLQYHQRNRILNKTNINPLYWDTKWLEEEYINKNRSAQDISNECGVHLRRIEKYIKLYKLDNKFISPRTKMPKELLYNLYIDKHFQLEEIRLKYKIDCSTLTKLLDEYQIPRRNHSESMAIYYDERGGRELKSRDNKEIWMREGYKDKMIEIMKTSPKVKDGRIKFSANYQGLELSEWKEHLTKLNTRIRNSKEYKDWTEIIFKQDDYTCQCCGNRSSKGNSVYLNAHHKENFANNKELRFDINNGITLCNKCHDPRIKGSFHNLYGCKNNNTKQLNEYIKIRQSEVA